MSYPSTLGFNGGSGSGGDLPTFTPPESPFIDESARDVWAAANLDLLYNADENFSFTLLEANSIAQRWSGENKPASYTASFWIDAGATATLVVDDLTSTSPTSALSANQGRILDEGLSLATATTVDLLITPAIKSVYVDASNNPVILTLDDNPRNGEHKLIYVGHNENLITLNSANPSFPIGDVPIIAEPKRKRLMGNGW